MAEATPMHSSISKVRPDLSPMRTQRMMSTVSRISTVMQPIIPSSSPIQEKIKSVCLPVKAV